MDAAEPDFKPGGRSLESSLEPSSRVSSRHTSYAPTSPHKRRRLSVSPTRNHITATRKYHLEGHYNDEYRILFNDTINSIASTASEESFQPPSGQIGGSIWTKKEKSVFFAVLTRVGPNNVRAIADALGTKTAPEVQDFLIHIHDALHQRRDPELTLLDVPAAIELSNDCVEQLEIAGDTLAWYQEKFEAKQEQERYGKYWLITPEVGEEIESTIRLPEDSLSPSPVEGIEEQYDQRKERPQILQEIPEADLLNPSALLELSRSVFMNNTPELHWTTLISPLASSPSIYRTAFADFHTLVVSLTRRLIQASVVQATSRLRSQGWRSKKGLKQFIKSTDVYTAVDMLRLQRDSKQFWKGMARRCGLQVMKGTGKREVALGWDEAEELLDVDGRRTTSASTDLDATGNTSASEAGDFQHRALRHGTPLPSRMSSDPEEDVHQHDSDEVASDKEYDTEGSYDEVYDSDGATSLSPQAIDNKRDESAERVLTTIINFDLEASKLEEQHLCEILQTSPPKGLAAIATEDEAVDKEIEKPFLIAENWREYLDYRAEWEEYQKPVVASKFEANEKGLDPSTVVQSIEGFNGYHGGAQDEDNERRTKRRKVIEADIPILGAGAYAARASEAGQALQSVENIGSDSGDDFELPAESIETSE